MINEYDISTQSEHNQKLYSFVVLPLMWLAFFVTVYVVVNTPSVEGAELFFLLPFSFGACCLFFGKSLIAYQNGGLALKVFYAVIFVRYVMLPFFTCQVGSFYLTKFTPAAYRYSIFIQIVELFTSCIALKYFYVRQFNYVSRIYKQFNISHYDNLTIGGAIVIVSSLLLLFSRGIDNLLMSMRFFVVDEALDSEAHYSYDIWAAQTLKAFVVIVLTSIFQKRNDKKQSWINVVIPLFLVTLSVIVVFGNNRMMLVYYALSGLSILLYAFPKQNKIIIGTLVSTLIIVLVSFTLIKNFGVSSSRQDEINIKNSELTGTLSLYVCSTESGAKAFDMYSYTGNQMHGLKTIWADLVDKTIILKLPFLSKLVDPTVKGIVPSYKLAMTGSEVVPIAGQTLYYGTPYFGWLLDIFVFCFLMKLLSFLEVRSKKECALGKRYLFTWMSIIVAMSMCYHLGIMYSAFTYVPFFVSIALLFNNIVCFSKDKILHEKIY